MQANKALILGEIETTYGTDPTPTIAANAIITTVPTIEYLTETKERTVVAPCFGKIAGVIVGQGIKITFSTELKNGVSLGTAPALSPFLQACNMTEALDAGTETIYVPNSDIDGKSITIWFYKDGILHKATGCRGTFKLSATAGDLVMIDFEYTGLYGGAITDATFPTLASIEYGTVAPLVFKSGTFTFNSIALTISKFDFDIGNTVTRRLDANAATGVKSYSITQRETKGAFDPEVVALSTFNPWADFEAQTARAISVTLGQTGGNKIRIDIARTILEVPKYGERDNIQTYDLSFRTTALLTTADDDLIIRFM